MKAKLIQVVALRELNIGASRHEKVPSADEISKPREKKYTFTLPLQAARALCRSKTIAPAYANDARSLRKVGARCLPYFGGEPASEDAQDDEAPQDAPEAEAETEQRPSDDLEGVVMAALKSGLKDDLIAALESVGMNPDDFVTNGERAAALNGWLGEE